MAFEAINFWNTPNKPFVLSCATIWCAPWLMNALNNRFKGWILAWRSNNTDDNKQGNKAKYASGISWVVRNSRSKARIWKRYGRNSKYKNIY